MPLLLQFLCQNTNNMLRLLVLVGLLPVLLRAQASEEFIQEVVDRHNYWREKHGVPPVSSDATISKYAQDWADHLNKTDTFYHRSDSPYGENLAWSSPAGTGKDYVDQLYVKEAKFYLDNNYCGTEPDMSQFNKYGHYTQIVWKSSEKIGVGLTGSYCVVNYSPPGNMMGSFAENVPCLI